MQIQGWNKTKFFPLPSVWSNTWLPDTSQEVALSSDVTALPHLSHLSHHFPKSLARVKTLILLGRDAGNPLFAKYHGNQTPFAVDTPLGWSLVGTPSSSSISNTSLTFRSSSLALTFQRPDLLTLPHHSPRSGCSLAQDPFQEQVDDDLEDLSNDDRRFMEIVSNGIHVNSAGNLEMPLPFKTENPILPSNREEVCLRTSRTLIRLKSDKKKLSDCIKSVGKSLDAC